MDLTHRLSDSLFCVKCGAPAVVSMQGNVLRPCHVCGSRRFDGNARRTVESYRPPRQTWEQQLTAYDRAALKKMRIAHA